MKAIPEFYRIGSDPEFLFVSNREFRTIVSPANQIITANKVIALKSFIGTDNHQATAEMRPGPAHNIGRHLYDIAYGLHETDKWLASSKRHNQLKIVAQPWVGDEPLGGHIHCSFFIDEPDTQLVMKLNRVYKGDRVVQYDPEQIVPNVGPEHTDLFARYAQQRYNGDLYTDTDFAMQLDYLLLPFENAIQPWYDRQRRNSRYGGANGAGERVRQNVSYPKGSNKFNKLAYIHYEYRVPSTWLCHPWLAYSYLALAKLAMLNTQLIRDGDKKTIKTTLDPQNDVYRKMFETRLKHLTVKGKWTRDVRGLLDIIPRCFDQRAAWFSTPGQPIDIDAWRRLL